VGSGMCVGLGSGIVLVQCRDGSSGRRRLIEARDFGQVQRLFGFNEQTQVLFDPIVSLYSTTRENYKWLWQT